MKNIGPYDDLPTKNFWKTAVAEALCNGERFDFLTSGAPLGIDSKIASVGSCFAQHIGSWLTANNYNYQQSALETNAICSFAFGNIYTPRSLLQWLHLATDPDAPQINAGIYSKSGIYFDLLRPLFNEKGFYSENSLVDARRMAVEELRRVVESSDLFIFTLGLTEAWRDTEGIFYPVCPGVIQGKFDAKEHHFHNFSYDEIRSDLLLLRKTLTKLNKDITLILTVSPVPLTATATDNHVLVASHGSKSILRAAAGSLVNEFDNVLYFPSYEIVLSPLKLDPRFEDNKRTVKISAVEQVMTYFEEALTGEKALGVSTQTLALTSNEVICDEEMIKAIRKVDEEKRNDVPLQYLNLIGDSHAEKLSAALSRANVPHIGGQVMNGSGFSYQKFSLCAEEYFVPLENAGARKVWSHILNNLSALKDRGETPWIVSNIGQQTHINVSRFAAWMSSERPERAASCNAQDMADFLIEDQRDQITLLRRFADTGLNLLVFSDQPFLKCFEGLENLSPIFDLYNAVFEKLMQDLDITFINLASKFEQDGLSLVDYKSEIPDVDGTPDWCHGSNQYYDWVAGVILKSMP